MLLSIITINYNNLQGLKKTVESVVNQTWNEFEYIVIDGGSTDGSKEYLESQTNNIDYWVSEKDSGIFNAMNKGIRVAKGAYLLFLNSGDTLVNENVLANVSVKLTNDFDIYYGDVYRLYENGLKILKTYDKVLTFAFFVDSAIAHQSAFIKRELFETIFYYNEDYKIASDWEFLTCAICKYNVPYKHLGMIISNYDMNGISSQPGNRLLFKKERESCYIKHFPLFQEDYKELVTTRLFLNTEKTKLFIAIEKKKITRRLNYVILRIMKKFLI
jgi:glycosyltransferase involved in cell wall biosynthesis